MPQKPLIILHGYSDDEKSFKPLAKFLSKRGFVVRSIYLGKYLSLEDQITIEDLAKAMQRAIDDEELPTHQHALDIIVHSTGALVTREWLTRYYLEQGRSSPVHHLLMLAPANFGSPLAHKGKSMFGRIVKGWKTAGEVGEKILSALEMGSPYTRALARRDLFGKKSFYHPNGTMVGVLTGTKPYSSGFRKLVSKKGTDGTVYVCTANLNAVGMTLEFDPDISKPRRKNWTPAFSPLAFGVFEDRDHGSITRPDQGNGNLGEAVVRFLKLGNASEYASFAKDCEGLTAETQRTTPDDEYRHAYENVVVRVSDDLGNRVPDYFLAFYQYPGSHANLNSDEDELMIRMHGDILEEVHNYRDDPSHRSFIFDITDLEDMLGGGQPLHFSISAAKLSSRVAYQSAAALEGCELPVGSKRSRFWQRNKTLFCDIVIQRITDEEVFTLEAVQ